MSNIEIDRDKLYELLVERSKGTWLKHQEDASGIVSKAILNFLRESYPGDVEKQKDLLCAIYEIRRRLQEGVGERDKTNIIREIARRYGVEDKVLEALERIGGV